MVREGAVKTVDRVARILRTLSADASGGLALGDISRETGYGKTTTHRLLGALIDVGFVHQDSGNRRYRLGTAAVALGRSAHALDVAALVRPSLVQLAEETGDTVFASVPEGSSAVCVAREVGSYPIRTLTLAVGDRRPLGVGAGSLALLAGLDDEEIDDILLLNESWLERYPGFSAAALRELVARTRAAGHALNEGRIVAGMNAIGVPVLDARGRACASLSLAAISPRMTDERLPRLVDLLTQAAGRVSALMRETRAKEPLPGMPGVGHPANSESTRQEA
jgi:DNA-binding IclR family transcriptional regulator